MNSEEIKCCLKQMAPNLHVAVIARDEFKNVYIKPLPMAIVVNTDVKSGKGIHWTAWFIRTLKNDRIVGDYFDSYGNNFCKYNIFPPINTVTMSRKTLQSNYSNLCGAWVVAWIINRHKGKSTREFELEFGDNLMENDKKIKSLFVNNKPMKGGQSCCARSVNKL